MSVCVSNLPIFNPLLSERGSRASSSLSSRIFHLPSPVSRRIQPSRFIVMAAEGGENIDHLQRQSKLQQPQQSRKRSAQVAPIGLWDRFPTARTVQQMMETMDRLIDDPFAYSAGWPSPLPTETGGYSRGRIPWEVKEGEGEYKMRFDMPGMTKEDVKVWVEEKMLVVKAEKTPKKKDEDEKEEEEEWSAKSYGRYSCRIALPDNIQFEKIKAEVKDGVLYINIPKAGHDSKILDINVE